MKILKCMTKSTKTWFLTKIATAVLKKWTTRSEIASNTVNATIFITHSQILGYRKPAQQTGIAFFVRKCTNTRDSDEMMGNPRECLIMYSIYSKKTLWGFFFSFGAKRRIFFWVFASKYFFLGSASPRISKISPNPPSHGPQLAITAEMWKSRIFGKNAAGCWIIKKYEGCGGGIDVRNARTRA